MAPLASTPNSSSVTTDAVIVSRDRTLMIPEIVMVIGSFLPLFERAESGRHGLVTKWNPKHLLIAAAVCKVWRQTLTPVLWQIYDFAIMDWVPWGVLTQNIRHVRHLSLLDTEHKKHADLWEALTHHKNINKLEVHDAVFSVKRLLGSKAQNMKELKVSGNCTRMHPFLLLFVERQLALQSLELTRVKITKSDWTRIVYNKPHLKKLIISQQCEFVGFEDDDDEVKNETSTVNLKGKQSVGSMATEADAVANTINTNAPTSNGGGSNKRKSDDEGVDGGSNKRRRSQGSDLSLLSARTPEIIPVTHLVLSGNRLHLPFQKAIFKACPHVEKLEICYTHKADGTTIANLVGESCPKIRHLTLKSRRQPWTLAMLEGMPQSVEELILHTGQLDLDMVAAIKDRKDILTRLELDFGKGSKGKRRLECILLLLQACSELREFTYHNHAEGMLFQEVMLKKAWNLPNLRKLHFHGITFRAQYNDLSRVPVPDSWKKESRIRNHRCCSTRIVGDIDNPGNMAPSLLFDKALLDHVKGLPNISEVIVTEVKYRKRLN
ncbi:hypothetical protein EC957_007827 [Mortierella hygrophila]|uniref:F-box domain-containing protein n=1 Tax=Mortierella hygrophila TaxID=979708 RepID=A0A9P6EY71_9FUNG|nr:hypothetical protein EC957_007827 [Mortierella hygrophila]